MMREMTCNKYIKLRNKQLKYKKSMESDLKEQVIEPICHTLHEYKLISKAIDTYNNLLLKEDSFKIQLDSSEGQHVFKNYMGFIEELHHLLSVNTFNRQFRKSYTNAYKILYSESSLGYIPQIFDSAQQSFYYIWVNGQRFDFSQEVLSKGEALVESYYKLIHLLRFIHIRVDEKGHSFPICEQKQLTEKLEEFDLSWVQYQMIYIQELISIENVSKAKILEIVQIENQLTQYENQQKLKGKIFLAGLEYDHLRRKLSEMISKLNSIANIDGKGRDDLTYDILVAAENVLSTITNFQSRSVRLVAQKIRQSYENVREVLKFFGQNLQMVDPQLKNNPQLVAALLDYEAYWEKGKRYFLQRKKQSQIIAFSTIVDAAKEKYQNFTEMLEYSDPSIFWIIPSLIILRSLEGEDEGLAESFLQTMDISQKYEEYIKLKTSYNEWKRSQNPEHSFESYNKIEYLLINSNVESKEGMESKSPLDVIKMMNKIKELAVNLERVNPIDWNDMLGVLLIESD